jgi:hypothetical protein
MSVLVFGSIVLEVLAFIIIIYLSIKRRKKRYAVDPVALLRSKGRKIEVNLRKCEIKTNNYTEEVERYKGLPYSSDIQFGNAIMGDEMKNVKQVEINRSVIIYKHEGITYHSPVISKDKITLSFLLDSQEKTFIYTDPQTGDYYFDLEFLSRDK